MELGCLHSCQVDQYGARDGEGRANAITRRGSPRWESDRDPTSLEDGLYL